MFWRHNMRVIYIQSVKSAPGGKVVWERFAFIFSQPELLVPVRFVPEKIRMIGIFDWFHRFVFTVYIMFKLEQIHWYPPPIGRYTGAYSCLLCCSGPGLDVVLCDCTVTTTVVINDACLRYFLWKRSGHTNAWRTIVKRRYSVCRYSEDLLYVTIHFLFCGL